MCIMELVLIFEHSKKLPSSETPQVVPYEKLFDLIFTENKEGKKRSHRGQLKRPGLIT